MIKLYYYIAFAGAWAIGNGILHDIFVLIQKRPFGRDLIRLLVDGHIMIFAGIFYLLCYNGLKEQQALAYWVAITASVFMLGYCGLIFKLIPAIGMILINLVALIWLIVELQKIKS
jgi:hypothetical protein